MKNTIITIIILLVLGFGVYYFVSNNNSSVAPVDYSQTYNSELTNNQDANTNPAPDTSTLPPSNTTPAPSSATVNIKDFSFNPGTINIKTGSKVTWTNNDSVPHTVTSDSGNLLNSPRLSPGQSFSFTFTNSGSFSYHCTVHPMMKGVVVVTN